MNMRFFFLSVYIIRIFYFYRFILIYSSNRTHENDIPWRKQYDAAGVAIIFDKYEKVKIKVES